MNWDAVAAIGELVGAVAVLITLVYLATQIRQNTQAMRRQAAQQTFHLSFEEVALFTRDDNPEAWAKFRDEGWKALTPGERVIVGAIAITLFTTYDSHYINELIRGKRGVTSDTAWLLAKTLGTSLEFWMNPQVNCDLSSIVPPKGIKRLDA